MGDNASHTSDSQSNWTLSLCVMLCVIACTEKASTELLPFGYTKYACIRFGSP